jgi:hypothetical protein
MPIQPDVSARPFRLFCGVPGAHPELDLDACRGLPGANSRPGRARQAVRREQSCKHGRASIGVWFLLSFGGHS